MKLPKLFSFCSDKDSPINDTETNVKTTTKTSRNVAKYTFGNEFHGEKICNALCILWLFKGQTKNNVLGLCIETEYIRNTTTHE